MRDTYESPLSSRYASKEMLYLFSQDFKFSTWRRLWVALARAEMKLGLPISEEQIAEMEAQINNIDYEYAEKMERELRHDVMAHVHAFGEVCQKAKPIIHLGATSAFVGDNTDIIIIREGLGIIYKRLLTVISKLADFAMKYRSLPALGFTHLQPAQLTTVGKRASLWLYDFLTDAREIEHRMKNLEFLGSKGTTGTQASFLELFGGDHGKCVELDRMISREMGFDAVIPVSGQIYSRKTDSNVLAALSGVAQSAAKFATDIRLLAHMKEVDEPFEEAQVGSSAMPYKRNPMRCERICALARYVIVDSLNPAMTAYNQCLERTLDDSANRRISIPEAFLALDAVLNICDNVISGLRVYEKAIEKNIDAELPFLATENILMRAVLKGGDRQALHERIRVHSYAVATAIKEQGAENDLVARIARDPEFNLTENEISEELDAKNYIGRAPEQVVDFVESYVNPLIDVNRNLILESGGTLKV